MFYYFDDNYRCDDDNKRKDMHHMELQATINYVCLALDTCTKVGSQLYIKATLHYTTENFLDYQSSSYFMNPAPNTITYYPDENCMYPIADVNSDCSNASHECCQLGSVNLMGNDLPIMGENGFVPAIMSWPDNCEPQPLDDNNDAVPFQGIVYEKHIERVEQALQRSQNNFGLASTSSIHTREF